MPFYFRIPLPGPFGYSHRVGSKRRRRTTKTEYRPKRLTWKERKAAAERLAVVNARIDACQNRDTGRVLITRVQKCAQPGWYLITVEPGYRGEPDTHDTKITTPGMDKTRAGEYVANIQIRNGHVVAIHPATSPEST
jgi:hypothetical protein